MRDINYRRKQEARHYKKRLKISIDKLERYKEIVDENGNIDIIPNNIHKYKFEKFYKGYGIPTETDKEKVRYKRWKFQLKNNSIPRGQEWKGGKKDQGWDSFCKRLCRRNNRHFSKLIDYILPDRRFLVRASVSKGDPMPDYKIDWKNENII